MTDTKNALDLPSLLDFEGARWLQAQMVKRCDESIVLSASEVRFIGGLAAQLLLSGEKQWRKRNLRFAILSRSAAFDDGLTRMGISPSLFEQEK